MTGLVRASGAAGFALLALVSTPCFAIDVDMGAVTSAAAIDAASASVASQITQSQSQSDPVQLAAATAPSSGFSAFARAASVSAVAPTPAAHPVAVIPTVAVPSPVTMALPKPEVPAAPAVTTKPSGFSAFFPKIFPASAKAVSAVTALPGKLGGVIQNYLSSDTRDEEHECLATAVYYESKGEPLEGQLAVAKVVLNRVQSGRYASSVCGVVKQKSQFSFVRRGKLPSAPKSSPAWQRAVAVAAVARNNLAESVAKNALSFHATYVAPAWRRGLTRIARIGAHIFYR